MRCHQNERVAWVRRPPQRLHRHFFLPSVSTSFSLPCDSASLSVYLSLSLRPPSPESTPMAVSVTSSAALLSTFLLLSSPLLVVLAGNFNRDLDIIWGAGKAKILGNGQLLTLSLDRISGSAFQSKNRFLFGKIGMQLKLVPGNSAGTVTSYYLASEGSTWDEFDFEFLGNLSGQPYTVHTNVIQQGKGDREQQFRLWFDPTADFHTYSILWNPQTIIFYVDGSPIRQFRNLESAGIPFPKKQPMRIHSSLWNADDWATQGGLVKTDWTQAPFRASYRNFFAEACVWPNGASSCSPSSPWQGWLRAGLDAASYSRLRWVQKNYMIYNYCTDTKRFPRGFPPECAHTN